MAKYYHTTPDGNVPYTAAEEATRDAEIKAFQDSLPARRLERIKKIRLDKLRETDYMANSDYTMPENIKTWRQSLRDIPTNYTEGDYDAILDRVSDKTKSDFGQLTHAIWSKP